MSRRVFLVLNPASGGGWSTAHLARVRSRAAAVLVDHEIALTQAPGHASELARRAAEGGFDVVAAVGGDGTAHEVVNGLIRDGVPVSSHTAFGLVHQGTGGDLRRSLQGPRDLDRALADLNDCPLRPMDVIDARVTPLDGGPQVRRACVNVAGFGMNGRVVQLANAGSKRLGPKVTFLAATARAMLEHRAPEASLSWVDAAGTEGHWRGRLSSVFIANGEWCGGGMWVGRGGALDDGAADVTLIPELPFVRLVLGSPRLFTGTMDRVKGVSRTLVRSLLALTDTTNPILVDLDGELSGRLPARFKVIPQAMLVASQWSIQDAP